jgi:ATP-dependent DNA helicase RecQ
VEDGIKLTDSVAEALIGRCVSLDLEMHPATNRILSFAAVRGAPDGAVCAFRGGALPEALARLDRFVDDAAFLLGHNIIAFDLPHLGTADAELALLRRPAIDTLWLNPLAFPKNPYHHLVKHHQDGRLKAGHLNDPELDARLVLELLRDQLAALSTRNAQAPDFLVALHWLASRGDRDHDFDAVFAAVARVARISKPSVS